MNALKEIAMIKRNRSAKAAHVEPDLPITPMLDMAFQLLAFFVMTFNPTPAEGHLDMALPKVDGGASSETPPPSSLEDDDELVVSVEANANREIAKISLRDKNDTEGKSLGSDSAVLFRTLQDRLKANGGKQSKVKLEMAENLSYKLVIKLMDEIARAGYKQVAPALLGASPPPKK